MSFPKVVNIKSRSKLFGPTKFIGFHQIPIFGYGYGDNVVIDNISNNLMGYYRFDNYSLNDFSGNNRNLNNSPYEWANGISALGHKYSNNTQYHYNTNYDLSSDYEFSFSIWIRQDGGTSTTQTCYFHTGKIGGNDNTGIGLYADESNKITIVPFGNDSAKTRSYSFNPNTWYHVVLTAKKVRQNFASYRLYVNGEEKDVSSGTGWFEDSENYKGIIIGSNPENFVGPKNRRVDEVAIWNKVLSVSEVRHLYLNPDKSII